MGTSDETQRLNHLRDVHATACGRCHKARKVSVTRFLLY